ncbi:MAG: hybrid sensor histidine kinase/response regulator [Alphaproteobacteria bacterium]|nr:hybrid sensor histidine kinase/response regulator [Alphaproteobacteria bacterium]
MTEFLTETAESLTVVDAELVKLERDPNNADVLSKIFRLVHTIKGTCGFIGLPRLESVAHASENMLGKFRDGVLQVTPEAVTLIFQSLDRIKEILGGIERTEAEPQGDDSDLIARLTKAAAGNLSEEPASEPHASADEETPQDLPLVEHLAAQEASPLAPPVQANAQPRANDPQGVESSVASQSIRVNVDVIENLMVMVSELVLTRNQLLEMVRHKDDSEFKVPLQRLSNVTGELQEGVVKTRMQPIGNAWAKLPRIVRDLANELGKKIDLQMHGAETELDRQVLELIKDPLTHMIRNSADHGLETTAERKAVGKPETGIISLRAFHEGGHIIIEIADDGRGLPTDKIKAKALANGIVTQADLALMSEAQIHRFVFHAGLSTATKVTNVSGRGVGMDVVRSNIELIGGSVDLKSKQGAGSTFTIKIPLTLAIVSALIVGVQGMRFAIPQICVVELVRVAAGTEAQIERINQTPVLRLRNRLLPLVHLSEVLKVQGPPDAAVPSEAFIVVAQAAGRSFGMIVDSVFDTGEIVVKPVSPLIKDVAMFSGNTILGDGSVIMILDPIGVSSAVSSETTARSGSEDWRAGRVTAEKPRAQAQLIFRAGSPEPKSVPLALITRLEMVDAPRIEQSNGRFVLQYRGALLPLVVFDDGGAIKTEGRQAVLVFTDEDRNVGLAVDEIIDIVEEELNVELSAAKGGVLGSAVIRGKVTEIVDVSYYVSEVFRSWFAPAKSESSGGVSERRRVLVVNDSIFFSALIVPLISAAGYEVTEAPNADAALKLKEEGVSFDLILSDIERPGVGGNVMAEMVRNDPSWASTPVIGLVQKIDGATRGSRNPFDALVEKYDRDGLMATIRDRIESKERAA